MAAELKQMIFEALQLSEQERATLAGILIESLESETSDPDVEAAWAAEAQRRWEEIESGTVKTIPWKKSNHTSSNSEKS